MSALIEWLLTKGLPYILVGLLAATGAGVLVHKLDAAKLLTVEKNDALAQIKADAAARAEQKQLDTIALTAAQAENAAQSAAALQGNLQLAEVASHVSVKVVPCIPYGLVRVLDAAATGRNGSALVLPAGKSDDACSPVAVDALGRSVVANYYTARANAEQLNRLIGSFRQAAAAKP